MKKLRILVIGHQGRMGQLAKKVIASQADMTYVGGVGRQDSLGHALTQAVDVVLDVTEPHGLAQRIETILQAGCSPVIGTSGLKHDDLIRLQAHCPQGGLIVPNFSIMSVLSMQWAEQAAHFFPDCYIQETHHLQKKDAPSGTAMATAERIASARSQAHSTHQSQETLAGCFGGQHHQVPIHAFRAPGVLAQQSVHLHGQGEQISIQHQTHDYDAFRAGMILALKQVTTLRGLHLGLDCLLKDTWQAKSPASA